LQLVAENGLAGVAEGTIKNTWSGVSPRSLAAAMQDLVVPLLKGLDLRDEDAVASALARLPENRLAKGLVASACWTLRAAAVGRPLWQLLEGTREVQVCWTLTRRKPADMAAEAQDYCARYGFRTLKVKGGQGLETDLAALAAIRAAVGPEVQLYVDANSHYPRGEALDYVQRIASAGATVAEDPSPLAPDADFEALQRSCAIPILLDSSCSTLRDAELYLARGARAVSLKPGRVGLSETRAIHKRIAQRKLQSAVGIYAESALGTLVSLQQPASMPAEQTFFLMLRAQVSKLVPEIRDGRIALPEEPNFERLVDWEAVRRYKA
ncbi:MAG TPA: mandelate racemase/muconate lactonizing enzyme family protein, partial [Burkholderiales bacterium]|nr:mandelate racemase/muconate lactonizing enzyme family protein [Burkholderiales bacterium]